MVILPSVVHRLLWREIVSSDMNSSKQHREVGIHQEAERRPLTRGQPSACREPLDHKRKCPRLVLRRKAVGIGDQLHAPIG